VDVVNAANRKKRDAENNQKIRLLALIPLTLITVASYDHVEPMQWLLDVKPLVLP
jgi:hypothetical protein